MIPAPQGPVGKCRYRQLRVLDLSGSPVKGLAHLAKLKGLRALNLSYSKSVRTVSFVKHLPHLKSLDLTKTRVRDLAPLGGHPALEYCHANETPVHRLPIKPLPKLRSLWLLSTRVPMAQVRHFKRRNTKAKVWRRWRPALLHALHAATRLRFIRYRTTEIAGKPIVIFEERSPPKVRQFVAQLRYREQPKAIHACPGGPHIQFFQGDRLIDTVTIAHKTGLEWRRWPGMAKLDARSVKLLARTLSKGKLIFGP